MRKLIYCGILLLACAQLYAAPFRRSVKDTTNGWQITYNGKEILGFVIDGRRTFLIDSIADYGIITVDYYTDYPCGRCVAMLQFRDENGIGLAAVQKMGVGDGAPFKLPGKQFRQLMHNHKLGLYYRNKIDGWSEWMFIGVVKTAK